MKNRLILSFVLLLCMIEARATHIVGGQLFLTENKNSYYNYNIGLTLYFDALNGNPGAEDNQVVVYVFRKRDNASIGFVEIPKIERKSVSYTNQLCVISSTETIQITYATDIFLDASDFSDPEGYYIVWDRCCRNGTITNIKSPGDAGSLFYLEFSAIVQNGTAFHNSSPKFPDIEGDYACVNSPFLFNFGGTDPDGDSLSYRLVTPLQGFSTKDRPGIQAIGSSNYPKLTWIDGITNDNIIPGSKPLTVDYKTGMLSLTAGNLGLYVFAVQVDEFRNGIKIGTLIRDFQLRVVDCPKMDKPEILFKEKGKSTFYSSNQIVTIGKDDPNCFEVMVTDPSINELLQVSGRAIDQTQNYFSILPAQYRTTVANDTMRFQVCLDACFVTDDNRPIRIELIVQDESCPVPLTDTLVIYIRREGSENIPPVVTTSLSTSSLSYELSSSEGIIFEVTAIDPDTSSITLNAKGRGFDLADVGMLFGSKSGIGQLSSQFSWNPDCRIMNGDTSQTFTVDFITQDKACLAASDTTSVVLKLSDNSGKAVIDLPNVITPNGDGKNDCLIFDEISEGSCNDLFKDITIFNRWGKQVYYSKNKNQNWCPNAISAGYYFYVVQYTQKSFKGGLTVLK
ncbi:gliding motility-associated C-terminal domain-containing protein [Dyadobacter sp. CY345]|uniref:T9SS type B sorting domain-containing protein n=1 Tax=Dyadobacter sp. CY345 TaxID=2909335 RepID=UPI001F425A14|nr:gliding motility-associated C-terminal domain-containing protein [Dyadobacter sp. CY345]MCF2446482.1 gliding motility-associated C-terminal domain-containing protein [Dyadobacter sp. CY345]